MISQKEFFGEEKARIKINLIVPFKQNQTMITQK